VGRPHGAAGAVAADGAQRVRLPGGPAEVDRQEPPGCGPGVGQRASRAHGLLGLQTRAWFQAWPSAACPRSILQGPGPLPRSLPAQTARRRPSTCPTTAVRARRQGRIQACSVFSCLCLGVAVHRQRSRATCLLWFKSCHRPAPRTSGEHYNSVRLLDDYGRGPPRPIALGEGGATAAQLAQVRLTLAAADGRQGGQQRGQGSLAT
jgi:hypothetical protein